jgi:hypothetical protein
MRGGQHRTAAQSEREAHMLERLLPVRQQSFTPADSIEAPSDAHRPVSRADGLPGSSITVFSYGQSELHWKLTPGFL